MRFKIAMLRIFFVPTEVQIAIIGPELEARLRRDGKGSDRLVFLEIVRKIDDRDARFLDDRAASRDFADHEEIARAIEILREERGKVCAHVAGAGKSCAACGQPLRGGELREARRAAAAARDEAEREARRAAEAANPRPRPRASSARVTRTAFLTALMLGSQTLPRS